VRTGSLFPAGTCTTTPRQQWHEPTTADEQQMPAWQPANYHATHNTFRRCMLYCCDTLPLCAVLLAHAAVPLLSVSPQARQRVDLYVPKAAAVQPAPVVIFITGGLTVPHAVLHARYLAGQPSRSCPCCSQQVPAACLHQQLRKVLYGWRMLETPSYASRSACNGVMIAAWSHPAAARP
jgi:hypothetical protein